MGKLTHLNNKGEARMVDVSDKKITQRLAMARGTITMKPATFKLIAEGKVPKGDVFGVARVAGIMAAKETAHLIPMCHPLNLTSVKIDFHPDAQGSLIKIEARVQVTGQTGVEMEALTAVSAAALTIYDMAKAVDRGMVISDICLVKKSGGKSGVYSRDD
ncbi:MAG: cyclic pyranopterin monophosphate synthase MoaC [bacterium]|nr:cyclic pyranopterin monophosphate synthase MoaC [bacterium]